MAYIIAFLFIAAITGVSVLLTQYLSGDKIEKMRWEGNAAGVGERRGVYRALVGKPEGKRPLGRPRRRWEGNIKTDLKEMGCGGSVWIELAQYKDR